MSKEETSEDKKELERVAAIERRNRIERTRQYEIDDELQQLMCFLPVSQSRRIVSRTELLKMLYEQVVEIVNEDRVSVEQEKNAKIEKEGDTEK